MNETVKLQMMFCILLLALPSLHPPNCVPSKFPAFTGSSVSNFSIPPSVRQSLCIVHVKHGAYAQLDAQTFFK